MERSDRKRNSLIDRLKKDDIIRILDEYYTNVGRPVDKRPAYPEYTLQELKKCIVLHKIQLGEK